MAMTREALVALAFTASLLAPAHAAAQEIAGWTLVETDHFRFHFQTPAQVDPAVFAERGERTFAELTRIFTTASPSKIDFHVWADEAAAERTLGRPLAFARAEQFLIHTSASHTPAHELTHVFVFHAVHPARPSRFLEEGTATSLDASGRDRLAMARDAVRQGVSGHVMALWESADRMDNDAWYPVAGAFVDRLVARGGKQKFLALLKEQTVANARVIYGADFDRIVTEFEADLGRQDAPPSSPELDALREKAQQRMRADLSRYSREQFQEIERIYQTANGNLRGPDARAALLTLIEKYPGANRTGCAILYLAQISQGEERERLLKLAISDHGDAMYGDGAQVGPFARAQLAAMYAQSDRMADAKALAEDIATNFPAAVDHSGAPLVNMLRRMKLLE
jgi:hypothetical protein